MFKMDLGLGVELLLDDVESDFSLELKKFTDFTSRENEERHQKLFENVRKCETTADAEENELINKKWTNSLRDPSYYVNKYCVKGAVPKTEEFDVREWMRCVNEVKNLAPITTEQNGENFTRFQVKRPAKVSDEDESTQGEPARKTDFRSGLEEYDLQLAKNNGGIMPPEESPLFVYNSMKSYNSRKCLGMTNRRPNSSKTAPSANPSATINSLSTKEPETIDERLKNIDPEMVTTIQAQIIDSSTVSWNDVAGLEYAKQIIQESIVLPLLRPELFTGMRKPIRGILFFGPPGTGKTLLGKCIAAQSKSTFFSITASTLTSKWIGDGEKMVKALFAVAAVNRPAVVFIDEIDALLSQRSDSEHESSRRLKNEFLAQLDGIGTSQQDQVLVVGATNRPQELDDAARRRFTKRLYVPLPNIEARVHILTLQLNKDKSQKHTLTPDEIHRVGEMTEGYSCADVTDLCQEASMLPIRSLPFSVLPEIDANDIRGVTVDDFVAAFKSVRPSVASKDLDEFLKWNELYGSGVV